MKQYLFAALLALLIACSPQPVMEKQQMMDNKPVVEAVMEKAPAVESSDAEMEKVMDDTMPKETRMMEPGLIGGGVSRYYNWDKSMFDKAVSEGKTIFLEFSANWCPTCQKQEPHLIAGFAELNDPNVIGFKIHYKDDEMTPEHETLIKQYQVPYQYYKVILRNGQIIKRSPESWTKDKFLEEMRKL
jgi:thiol-disulfide isomerase/thioredoxin